MLLDQAIQDLDGVLAPAASARTSALAERITALREALLAEPVHARDGWLDARARRTDRDRRRLAARLAALGQRLLDRPGREPPLAEMRRLRVDVEHYRQRLHDLAYDKVGLELGGSE